MSEYVIKTSELVKQFKDYKAVNAVSLHVEKGAIYGFIGRNGAGKTTFLKMIAGLSEPTSGEIEVFGHTGKDRKCVLDRIGVLIEAPGLYLDMNAFDNLRMKAECMGLYRKEYINEILAIVGLSEVGNKKVKNFSLGMKQRLGIGLALVGNPDLLILDEPINGLDPQGIVEIRETILRLNHEKHITVLISSHILEELSKLVSHYGIIHEGVLIEELTRAELLEKCEERIKLCTENTNLACTLLEQYGIQKYKVVNQTTIHVYERLDEVAQINAYLVKHDVLVSEIAIRNESLEKYFMNVTEAENDVK